jgi:hypothetical protein
MSKGYNQSDIAKELHTTRRTVLRDVVGLNQWTKKGLYDLAKRSLSTMLYSCIIGLNEIEKEAWKIYRSNDNDKVYALRLLASRIRPFHESIKLPKTSFSLYLL